MRNLHHGRICRTSSASCESNYQCRFSRGAVDSDWSGKLRSVTDGGRGVFICDTCDEVMSMEELGYERMEAAD